MVLRNERGIAIFWVGVSLFLILAFAAIAIDLSFLYTDKNFLHVSADSASLAAVTQLASTSECQTSPGSLNDGARLTAQEYAGFHTGGGGENSVNGSVYLDLNRGNEEYGDVVLGNYTRDDGFTACVDNSGTPPINAVKVIAKRDDAPSFFGGIFGNRISNVGAYATAVAGVKADLPICVPSCIATNSDCEDILMQPETGENAAWTGFLGGKSTPELRALIANPESIPCVGTAEGITVSLDNGAKTPVMGDILDAFNAYLAENGGTEWCITIPTCEGTCDAPPYACSTVGNYGSADADLVGSTSFCVTEVIATGPATHGVRGHFESSPGTPVGSCSYLAE
jgi:Flp pilus assembly protein TadG